MGHSDMRNILTDHPSHLNNMAPARSRSGKPAPDKPLPAEPIRHSSASQPSQPSQPSVIPLCVSFETSQEIIHEITCDLRARAAETMHIFLSFRPQSDPLKARHFLTECRLGTPAQLRGPMLRQLIRATDEFVLMTALKWFWGHLEAPIVGWTVYDKFSATEKTARFPRTAFTDILPRCLVSASQASVVYDFFDLLFTLSSKSPINQMNGRKIAKVAGIWAFGMDGPRSGSEFAGRSGNKSGNRSGSGSGNLHTFSDGLELWKPAAAACFHLYVAFLKAALPENLTDLAVPRPLKAILGSEVYPPRSSAHARLVAVPVVTLRTSSGSATPLELIRKAAAVLDLPSTEDPEASAKLDASQREDLEVLRSVFRGGSVAQQNISPESARLLSVITDEIVAYEKKVRATIAAGGDAEELGPEKALEAWNVSSVDGRKGSVYRRWPSGMPSGTASGRSRPAATAELSRLLIDDYYCWVWMCAISPEQPDRLKTLFGRSVVLEVLIDGTDPATAPFFRQRYAENPTAAPGGKFHRWIVIEEIVQKPKAAAAFTTAPLPRTTTNTGSDRPPVAARVASAGRGSGISSISPTSGTSEASRPSRSSLLPSPSQEFPDSVTELYLDAYLHSDAESDRIVSVPVSDHTTDSSGTVGDIGGIGEVGEFGVETEKMTAEPDAEKPAQMVRSMLLDDVSGKRAERAEPAEQAGNSVGNFGGPSEPARLLPPMPPAPPAPPKPAKTAKAAKSRHVRPVADKDLPECPTSPAADQSGGKHCSPKASDLKHKLKLSGSITKQKLSAILQSPPSFRGHHRTKSSARESATTEIRSTPTSGTTNPVPNPVTNSPQRNRRLPELPAPQAPQFTRTDRHISIPPPFEELAPLDIELPTPVDEHFAQDMEHEIAALTSSLTPVEEAEYDDRRPNEPRYNYPWGRTPKRRFRTEGESAESSAEPHSASVRTLSTPSTPSTPRSQSPQRPQQPQQPQGAVRADLPNATPKGDWAPSDGPPPSPRAAFAAKFDAAAAPPLSPETPHSPQSRRTGSPLRHELSADSDDLADDEGYSEPLSLRVAEMSLNSATGTEENTEVETETAAEAAAEATDFNAVRAPCAPYAVGGDLGNGSAVSLQSGGQLTTETVHSQVEAVDMTDAARKPLPAIRLPKLERKPPPGRARKPPEALRGAEVPSVESLESGSGSGNSSGNGSDSSLHFIQKSTRDRKTSERTETARSPASAAPRSRRSPAPQGMPTGHWGPPGVPESHWGQPGPAGPAGPAGPLGPPGPLGPYGPAAGTFGNPGMRPTHLSPQAQPGMAVPAATARTLSPAPSSGSWGSSGSSGGMSRPSRPGGSGSSANSGPYPQPRNRSLPNMEEMMKPGQNPGGYSGYGGYGGYGGYQGGIAPGVPGSGQGGSFGQQVMPQTGPGVEGSGSTGNGQRRSAPMTSDHQASGPTGPVAYPPPQGPGGYWYPPQGYGPPDGYQQGYMPPGAGYYGPVPYMYGPAGFPGYGGAAGGWGGYPGGPGGAGGATGPGAMPGVAGIPVASRDQRHHANRKAGDKKKLRDALKDETFGMI